MTPEHFIAKWDLARTSERASSHEHFLDLCRLLDHPTPHDIDPNGEHFAFERGARKAGEGTSGWADVWKRHHFGWEYKRKSGGRSQTLEKALQQLQLYALALESPPLLIVSDIDVIEIHTAFQNAVQESHRIELAELADPIQLDLLRSCFFDVERLRPARTRDEITVAAATQFALLAEALRERGNGPERVAHFLNRLLFCMYAEDAGLLRTNLFSDIVERGVAAPGQFDPMIRRLFSVMRTGGTFGLESVSWFNGGLFDSDDSVALEATELRSILDLSRMDWSQIEPAIFGTLFERGLDPAKRAELGAHYTDSASIELIVQPVVLAPLEHEWEEARARITEIVSALDTTDDSGWITRRRREASQVLAAFLERLAQFRVLDPACGSGNFLYMALRALKSLEHRVNLEAEALGLERQNALVGPQNVLGIEISEYAAELARVTVWIGEIQWTLASGYDLDRSPVLRSLDNIQCRDALVSNDGEIAPWPICDVIIGNPPFVGDRSFNAKLGAVYAERLRTCYSGFLPRSANLVCYWFHRAHQAILADDAQAAGLVATSKIRFGNNRQVLDQIVADGVIFDAWQDRLWINDGAHVRTSIIAFAGSGTFQPVHLDGEPVEQLRADLTSAAVGVDLSDAQTLSSNRSVSDQGGILVGPFVVDGPTGQAWRALPANPDGSSNTDVIRRLFTTTDLVERPRDRWVIDFGTERTESEAALFEAPFAYALEHIKPFRESEGRETRARGRWWIHHNTRPGFRDRIAPLKRYIATPRVSKHRLFVTLPTSVLPDTRIVGIARQDLATFGILHSRVHEAWSSATCPPHGVGNDPTYNKSNTFDTFSFPDGFEPNRSHEPLGTDHERMIEHSAARLLELRDRWLNPPEWIALSPPGSDGLVSVAVAGHERDLATRGLTALYNDAPTWLTNAHRELDAAVFAAYGWPLDLDDDAILTRLLERNLRDMPH